MFHMSHLYQNFIRYSWPWCAVSQSQLSLTFNRELSGFNNKFHILHASDSSRQAYSWSAGQDNLQPLLKFKVYYRLFANSSCSIHVDSIFPYTLCNLRTKFCVKNKEHVNCKRLLRDGGSCNWANKHVTCNGLTMFLTRSGSRHRNAASAYIWRTKLQNFLWTKPGNKKAWQNGIGQAQVVNLQWEGNVKRSEISGRTKKQKVLICCFTSTWR
jgi:hypothetical protein